MEKFMIIMFLQFWGWAWLVSFGLIFFRSDRASIINDLLGMVFKGEMVSGVVSIALIFFLLPLTIPYSIANILGYKK